IAPTRRFGIEVKPDTFAAEALARAVDAHTESNVIASQTKVAQRIQQDNYAEAITKNEDLRERAGGIAGPDGADTALSSAIKTIRASYSESVEEAREVMK